MNNKQKMDFKYRKSKHGCLNRAYSELVRRVKGKERIPSSRRIGKKLENRNAFLKWANANGKFNRLFKNWASHNYDTRLTPIITRIDDNGDYIIDNLIWTTKSEHTSMLNILRRTDRPEIRAIYKLVGLK